jgi:hypothetical protein
LARKVRRGLSQEGPKKKETGAGGGLGLEGLGDGGGGFAIPAEVFAGLVGGVESDAGSGEELAAGGEEEGVGGEVGFPGGEAEEADTGFELAEVVAEVDALDGLGDADAEGDAGAAHEGFLTEEEGIGGAAVAGFDLHAAGVDFGKEEVIEGVVDEGGFGAEVAGREVPAEAGADEAAEFKEVVGRADAAAGAIAFEAAAEEA